MTVTSAADRRAAAQLRRHAADAERHARGDIAYRAFRSAPPIGTARRGRPAPGELKAKAETRNGKDMVHTWGYFTRYNRYYPMWDQFGGYREQVCGGAGARTLAAKPEVAFLTNHAGMAMARTTTGSLELREQPEGGWHDGWLNPKRSDVSDLLIAIDDGDVPQMSFAFVIPENGGWWSDDFESFDITEYDIDNGDVSAVNFGANPFTDISARLPEVLDDLARLPAGAAEEASARLALRGTGRRERVEVREQRGPRPAPGAYADRLAARLERTVDRMKAHHGGDRATWIEMLRNQPLPWYEIRNAAGDDQVSPDGQDDENGVATVFIFDEIGGSMGVNAKQFAADLEEITAPNIKLRINSPGGSVMDGIAIHSALLHHPSRVTAYIDGWACSAASFLAMAADEIVMMPGSELMIHDASATVEGNADDMARFTTFLDRQSDNIADMYMRVGGGTREEWRALMLDETWMLAAEAVEMGLADRVEVVERRRPAGEVEERMARKHDLRKFGYRYESRSAAPRPQRRTTTTYGERFARGGRIENLLEASSLGMPDAVAMRERTSPEVAEQIVERSKNVPATQDRPTGRSIALIEARLDLD